MMNQETWDSVRESILKDVEGIHDGAFVAMECGQEMADAVSPYAQIARVGNRYLCEIASNTFLPGDSWPLHLDTFFGQRDGICRTRTSQIGTANGPVPMPQRLPSFTDYGTGGGVPILA